MLSNSNLFYFLLVFFQTIRQEILDLILRNFLLYLTSFSSEQSEFFISIFLPDLQC